MCSNKATVFFKKSNNQIIRICSGESNLNYLDYNNLMISKEDAELLFDYFIIDYDSYIFENILHFYIVVDDKGNKQLKLKEEYIENMKKYL